MMRIIPAIIICTIAAVLDIKKGKISDKITYPAIIIGIILNLYLSTGMLKTLLIPTIAFFFGVVMNKIGLWGGGDVKLFTMLVAFLPGFVIQLFLFPLFFIIPASIFKAARNRGSYFDAGEFKREKLTDQKVSLPSGPAFLAGLGLCWFLQFLVI